MRFLPYNFPFGQRFAVVSFLAASASSGWAHLSYGAGLTGRNFNLLPGFAAGPVTAAAQAVTGSYGWADGTDADWGDSHRLRAYRFTLSYDALVTVSVQDTAIGTGSAAGLLPGFSLYGGLAHLAPLPPDHDGSAGSIANRPGTAEGSFQALRDWSMWNDGTEFDPAYGTAEETRFTFRGYAVDGSAANFGNASGLLGDGLADGFITGTFSLAPGDYSLFVGGANYADEAAAVLTSYGISTTLSVVPIPEPAVGGLAGLAFAGLAMRRSRR